jgi:hypothetical protein
MCHELPFQLQTNGGETDAVQFSPQIHSVSLKKQNKLHHLKIESKPNISWLITVLENVTSCRISFLARGASKFVQQKETVSVIVQ